MRTQFEELMCQLDSVKFVARACVDPEAKFASAFTAWLYDWQTLVAGILAVIASLIGGGLIWNQGRLQRQQIEQQRQALELQQEQMWQEDRRRAIAARIPLARALSETLVYLKGCYEAWLAEKPETRPGQPIDAMQVIMDAAISVDQETFKTINRLVSLFQVFEARVSHRGRARPSNVLDVMIVDIAEMAFQTNRLYDFARMEEGVEHVEFAKPKRADLEHVLNSEFEMKLLLGDSEAVLRAQRALYHRFPGTRPDAERTSRNHS